MAEIDPVKYGVMWEKVNSMETEMVEMRADIKELLAMANKGRGGFWVGMMIVSAISSLIGFLASNFSTK
jgi:hypothetical protein